jgi:hypothetical protein
MARTVPAGDAGVRDIFLRATGLQFFLPRDGKCRYDRRRCAPGARSSRHPGIAAAPMPIPRLHTLSCLAAAAALQACVYAPKTVHVYDRHCQIVARHMVMEQVQVTGLAGCRDEACLTAVGVTAASAVIAGTVVVAGNVVYWFERIGQCQPEKAVGPAVPAASAPLSS